MRFKKNLKYNKNIRVGTVPGNLHLSFDQTRRHLRCSYDNHPVRRTRMVCTRFSMSSRRTEKYTDLLSLSTSRRGSTCASGCEDFLSRYITPTRDVY